MDESNKAVFGMSCMLKAGDEPNGFMAKAVLVNEEKEQGNGEKEKSGLDS
jgi:hypothetical protein